ncbi:MAG TPA: bifunctional phosphoglucose/phosphomannose isomerase [Candidatus Saccharimonas sp.]|nr:bifunctional phosphoglucose/phosphomannose isomerase [Candidatus Saccharimonas sp.]
MKTPVLDQPEYIARYDKYAVLGVVASQPEQLRHEFALGDLGDLSGVRQVVVAGMGGSALAAELVKTWLGERLTVPMVIVRDYALPGFVGPQTLVMASSYSGNTEEALAAYEDAARRGAKMVVMAAGGELLEAARANGHAHLPLPQHHPHFDLPPGLQPRLAVWFGVKALAVLLEKAGLVRGAAAELAPTADWLEGHLAQWGGGVPAAQNRAKQIAMELAGHPVVIYGGPRLAPAAMKWKIDLNENGKNLAFYNYFSELNHNEFTGWLHPLEHPFKVVELRSGLDNEQIQKRFDITNKLLADRFTPIEVVAEGKTQLEQLLWTILLGDFVSAYVAFLNEIDPTPVELIEKLKHELG